jgi:hypothetical protein
MHQTHATTMTPDADILSSQRMKSGLLVFTATLELIHLNEEALVLSSYINQTQTGYVVAGIVQQEVLTFAIGLSSD